MTILDALYNKDGRNLKIYPNTIKTAQDYYEKGYYDNLYCSEEGCNAKIVWTSRLQKPHFRTWPKEEHTENCKYKVIRTSGNSPRKYVGAVEGSLSDNHIRGIFRDAIRKNKGEGARLSNQYRKKQASRQVDPNQPIEEVTMLIPTSNTSQEGSGTKVKEPSVVRRHCDDFDSSNIDNFICVYGAVTSLEINENSIKLFFKSQKHKSFYILLPEGFKKTNEQSFDWIKSFFENNCSDLQLNAYAIGHLKSISEDFYVSVILEKYLQLNDKTVIRFITEKSIEGLLK